MLMQMDTPVQTDAGTLTDRQRTLLDAAGRVADGDGTYTIADLARESGMTAYVIQVTRRELMDRKLWVYRGRQRNTPGVMKFDDEELAELKEEVRLEACEARRACVAWRGLRSPYRHHEPRPARDLAEQVHRYVREWKAWRAGAGPNPVLSFGRDGEDEEEGGESWE